MLVREPASIPGCNVASFELSEAFPLPSCRWHHLLMLWSWRGSVRITFSEERGHTSEGLGPRPALLPVLQAVGELCLGFTLSDCISPDPGQGLPFGGRVQKDLPCVRPCRCCAGSKGPAAHLGKVLGRRLSHRGPPHVALAGQWGDWWPMLSGWLQAGAVDHYSVLPAEAARLEQRALWKVRRHRPGPAAALRFLLEDEKRISGVATRHPGALLWARGLRSPEVTQTHCVPTGVGFG